MRALCVSIHDVAPATWPLCQRLERAVREVAPVPLTWLVVPCYHGDAARSAAMEAHLAALQAGGDELALHGYTHLDPSPPRQRGAMPGPQSRSLRDRYLRTVYTRSEGEFSALDEAEAASRLESGLAWFAARGWHPSGFVPPAWLLSDPAWRALRRSTLAYATTYTRLHDLRGGQSVYSPSLVYTARNVPGRLLSPPAMGALAALLAGSPLVRLSLHPNDARYPHLLRHAQRLTERLLASREPMTKLAFSQKYFQ